MHWLSHKNTFFLIACSVWFHCCTEQPETEHGQNISTDQTLIAAGAKLFTQHCRVCHNFRQNGIGPQLGGVTREVEETWLRKFLENPSIMIRDQDPRAKMLFTKYKTYMPSYSMLEKEDIDGLLAYLHTHEKPEGSLDVDIGRKEVPDPIQEKVSASDLVLNVSERWQIPQSAEISPLARINEMGCEKNSGRLFVLDLRGKLYELGENDLHIYFDISTALPDFINEPGLNTGFGSFAFHPDFIHNGLLYTTHCEPTGTASADQAVTEGPIGMQYILREWQTNDPGGVEFQGEGRELLRMDMTTTEHGFQTIAFNPTALEGNADYGMLYLGIGDAACVEAGYAQYSHHHGTRLWSSIIRIDPSGSNSSNGKYGIPPDNPFANDSEKRPELYAYGFRNPHQLHWDAAGNLFATDIGVRNIEEVNLVKSGADYGWPTREGRFFLNHLGNVSKVYELPSDDAGITYPVVELDHDEMQAIVGGFVYEGDELPQLSGKYIFGDIPSGKLFYTPLSEMLNPERSPVYNWQISIDGKITTLLELCASDRAGLRFGQDCEGNVYLFTKTDGKIYAVVNN